MIQILAIVLSQSTGWATHTYLRLQMLLPGCFALPSCAPRSRPTWGYVRG